MIRAAILLFTFMTAIDITILSTVMPKIIAALGDMAYYPLMSSAYLSAFFIATPLFGKFADLYGCKKAAYIALTGFLLGSLLCGLALSMQQLIFSRLVQGAGAAGLVNVSYVTIARIYQDDKQRSFMQAVLSSVWAVASIIGPLVGAAIAVAYSWRLLFFINLPIGIIAFLFIKTYNEVYERPKTTFDRLSLITFIVGSFLPFLAFTKLMLNYRWPLISTGVLFIAFFIYRTLHISSPLVPLKLLKNRLIAICILFGLIGGACMTTAHSMVSLYIQGALRQSLQSAGFVIMATSIGWSIGSFFTTFLLTKFSLRYAALFSALMLLCGFSLLSQADLSVSLSYFMLSNTIVGLGLGSMINLTIVGVQKGASHQLLGRATSFLSLMRSLGASLGAASAGALQLHYFKKELSTLSTPLAETLLQAPEKFLSPSFEAPQLYYSFFALSIEKVFLILVIMLILLLPMLLLFPRKQNH